MYIIANKCPTIIYHDEVKVVFVNLLVCLTWKKGQKLLLIRYAKWQMFNYTDGSFS